MLFLLCGIVFLAGSLFGGATHAGYAGDIAAQLASIPLLAGALWPALSEHDPRRYKARAVFGLFCVIAFITSHSGSAIALPSLAWRRSPPILRPGTGGRAASVDNAVADTASDLGGGGVPDRSTCGVRGGHAARAQSKADAVLAAAGARRPVAVPGLRAGGTGTAKRASLLRRHQPGRGGRAVCEPQSFCRTSLRHTGPCGDVVPDDRGKRPGAREDWEQGHPCGLPPPPCFSWLSSPGLPFRVQRGA